MMARPLTEGLLATERLTVHHIHAPHRDRTAPRVLFLGGSNFDLTLKRAFLNSDLAHGFTFATYEPRGIGRTEHPEGSWNMQDYAKDALAVMDALEWDSAAIVGESFGGMTALHLAGLAPDRVTAIVVASATAGGPVHRSFDISSFLSLSRRDAAIEALCLQDTRNIAQQTQDPDGFAQKLAARVQFEEAFAQPSIASGGYARLLDARRRHDCTGVLPYIETPTCVLAGRFDQQARPEAQQALADALPQGQFHLFDAGHGVLFAAPKATETAAAFIRTQWTNRAAKRKALM
ncbi:alpha/beta hydrolase [uncultured Tateyamaria sp.]|uniref:alpha/beta fold hydrolase n=1 Tax=uncultured Tateyamaria sp. TaxID=455651 RepID=UPI0026041E94|nr:alpha/beta hydrolase [uncultured Tateyamaria sp.]